MKGKITRQLAAVMFTDIVGYTALMQKNEAVAMRIRSRHREVFESLHKIYNGEIIQYYGDGTLSVFKSAIEAANCAIQIQNLLLGNDPVPVRIGLHMGDIVYSETEVYGDGVNFASRIESMSVAGGILLSDKLNDELKNHPTISTTSLGHFELKNIEKPVEVFAICNEGIRVPLLQEIGGKQKNNYKTIAVLPFTNMSTNAENEYFSDGITEEIINALAKIKRLKVTSRTSSFFFKNKNVPIKQIAKELDVSAILEGSVRLAGDTVRITAQLIQTKEDFHFWSETWDRKLENIFEVQDEISLLIADKLREHFGHFEINEHLVTKPTDSISAYEYCLKAKFHKNKWNPKDVETAISFYDKALKIDPKYSEALVGKADCYSFLGTTGFMPFEEAWGRTIQYTNQAIELNDESSGVYYQLSNQAFFIECDYAKSLTQMKKAIEINPNNADAQQFISFLYIIAGNRAKAKNHLDIALSINPLSDETHFFRAYFHYMIEDYQKALTMLNRCITNNSKNIPAHSVKILCLFKLGKFDEVITYFDNVPEDVIIEGEKTGAIALAYAMKKDKANIIQYQRQLEEQTKAPNGFTADSYLFLMHAVLGEVDKAFQWVEKALQNKASLLLLRYTDPMVFDLKKDSRYTKYQKIIYPNSNEALPIGSKKALLDEEATATYKNRLLALFDKEKPYLDSDLSLRSLANHLEMHPNQLSWLLNESIGKNFNEFVNHYRVEAFKEIANDPNNSHLSLIGLAYDSGFNSKTVFNTYFKKETGLTPKQFLKNQDKSDF
ncbi:helix-turn-helix domain-containing protein [Cyclobacterium marinum]|uniref:helix-turn-helix domain-containing protein n=1 Tax=Cyclobacterium marinum TaxID=104 RepID=UPI0030DBC1A7|tara:strand:- start:3826 stop:6165 length:2340 start_codon:yes stop_codon:yes gene_type:complete